MSARTIGYRIAWILSLGLLLVTGVLGVYNGITERGQGETALQKSVTIGVLVYGVLGLVSAYGLIRRQRWSLATVIAWAVVVTYVPGVAVMADGGGPLGAALAASGATLLLALGVLWTTNAMTRPHQVRQ